MDPIAAVVAALVLGFLLGLLSFKKKSQWCPTCGATLCCPQQRTHQATTTAPVDRRRTGRDRRRNQRDEP